MSSTLSDRLLDNIRSTVQVAKPVIDDVVASCLRHENAYPIPGQRPPYSHLPPNVYVELAFMSDYLREICRYGYSSNVAEFVKAAMRCYQQHVEGFENDTPLLVDEFLIKFHQSRAPFGNKHGRTRYTAARIAAGIDALLPYPTVLNSYIATNELIFLEQFLDGGNSLTHEDLNAVSQVNENLYQSYRYQARFVRESLTRTSDGRNLMKFGLDKLVDDPDDALDDRTIAGIKANVRFEALIAAGEVAADAGAAAQAAKVNAEITLKAIVENSAIPNQRDVERIVRAFWDLVPLAERASMLWQSYSDAGMRESDIRNCESDSTLKDSAFTSSQEALHWRDQAKNARSLTDPSNVADYVSKLRQQRSGCGMTVLAIAAFVSAVVVAFA